MKNNATLRGTALKTNCKNSQKLWEQMGQIAQMTSEKRTLLTIAASHKLGEDYETFGQSLETLQKLSESLDDITYQEGFCYYITAGKDFEPSVADDFADVSALLTGYYLEHGVHATCHRVTESRANQLESAACKRHKVNSIMWA